MSDSDDEERLEGILRRLKAKLDVLEPARARAKLKVEAFRDMPALLTKLDALRADTGFMRPCLVCGEPMLPSLTGRGYCLPCAFPPDDIPCVPVIFEPKAFWRIQRTWENPDDISSKVRAAIRAAEKIAKQSRKRGGRPSKLTAQDVKKIRWMVANQPFTLASLAANRNVHPRTMRRFLKKHGLKLHKRPTRRS